MKNNLLLVLLMFLSFEVFAAAGSITTYNLPSIIPSGCTRAINNSQVVNCPGDLILGQNITVNVTGAVVMNITGSANLRNAKVNLSGNAANLTINIGNDLTTDSDFQAKANIIVNDEANLSSSNVLTGDITARVLNTNSSTSINGNINAAFVDIGSGNTVTGNISTTNYLEISSSGTIVNGNLQSNLDVFIGSNAVINGSVTSGRDLLTDSPITINGPVSVVNNFNLKGSNSTVNGNVTAANLTMAFSNGRINGDVTVEQILVVGGSKIVGSVFANQISLPDGSGQIEGDVMANESIKIGYGGQVIGDITSPHIENNGAITGSTFCDTSNGQNPATCTAVNSNLSWNFNESAWTGAVGEVLDSSTNALHGRAMNGAFTADITPAIATTNGLGTCGYGNFVGTGASAGSSLVTAPKSSYMNNANSFSVAFWVKSSGAAGHIYLAYGRNNNTINNRFLVYRDDNNRLAFRVVMRDGTFRTVTRTDSTVSNGAWHHVVAVYSYSNSELSLYLNGNRQSLDFNHANNNARTPIDISADSAAAFGMGAYPDSTYGMTGQMDEVRFFNRVLNTTEINALRTETSSCISAAPVLSWNLNVSAWTGAASEVLDTSGNSLNGRTFNSLLSSISAPALTGDPGTCAFSQFNGSNQYIAVADNNKLDITDELTVAIWVRPRAYPGSDLMTILSKDTNYEFHLTPAGKIYWWWHDQDGVERTLTSNGSIPLNQWTHVAITYKNGAQRIYINGSTDINTGSYTKKLATNNLPMEVGRDNVANRYFNGDLDEVRIYAKAQTQSKINEIMQERNSCSLIANCLLTEEFTDYAQWYRTVRSGAVPELVNGRLQLTNNDPNQSTSITFKQAFPTAGNKLTIEFDHFAYGGNGADGIALVLSDATKTPVPGSFGGSLGYAPRTNVSPVQPGFAGGWLGIGFDEFGNYAKATEGRTGGVATNIDSAQAIGVRGAGSGTSGYSWLGWSGKLARSLSISGSTPGRGDRFRITIDTATNASQVAFSLERRPAGTNTFTEVLNSSNVNLTNQPAMPTNFLLSFTGSTGTNTNFHALDNVQVCSFKTPVPVAIGEESIHHFELSYGNSLTCSPTEVTVKACANVDCSQLYANQVSLQLTANNGAVFESSGSITFTGSQTINLVKTVVGATTIGIQPGSASVSTTNALQCKQNGVTSNCSLSFADSGFVFDVQDMIANQSQNVLIRAVRKDDSSQQCVPGFRNVTRPVKLWSDYIEPNAAARPESRSVLVNGIAIPKSYDLNDPNLSQNLSFNSNGQATIALNYIDAGKMQLNARYEGSASTSDNGLIMIGSDQFVSRPAGLCIREGNGLAAALSCSSPYETCNIYKKAGEDFNLAVIAKASDNDGDTNLCANTEVTPNFRLTDIPVSHSLLAPTVAQGGSLGDISTDEYDHSPSINAVSSFVQQVSEAGVFSFNTPALDYLGTTIPAATSHAIGRFIPAYFSVDTNTPVLAATCGAFNYLGKELTYSTNPLATFTARNMTGSVTNNYGGAFFRASALATTASVLNTLYATTSPTAAMAGVSRGSYGLTGQTDYDGQFSLILTSDTVNFNRTVEPPYPDPFVPDLRLESPDSFIVDSDAVCIRSSAAGVCEDLVFNDITVPQLRYGRLVLKGGNVADGAAAGATLVPLTFSTEYWLGTAFILNTDDSCTLINPVDVSFDAVGQADNLTVTGSSYTLTAGLKGTAAGLNVSIPLPVPAKRPLNGIWPVFYAAPSWLKYNWQKESGTQIADNPSSEVSVGRYRGNKRQIFWQERLN